MSFFSFLNYAMQEIPQSPRMAARMNTFKMKQLEKLKETMPEIKNKLGMVTRRKEAAKEWLVKNTRQSPYVGPAVFDIINCNRVISTEQFALSDQDEPASDVYQVTNKFPKVMNLRSPVEPYGINALDTNNRNQLITDAGKNIIVWDLEQGQQIAVLKGHAEVVTSLKFNPKAMSVLASGSEDTTVKIWDIRVPERAVQTINDDAKIYSVDYSPDGTELVSVNAAATKALSLWIVKNGMKYAKADGSWTAKYNNQGNYILAGLPGKLVLYDSSDLELVNSLELPENWLKNNAIPGSFDFSQGDASVVVSGPLADIFIFNGDLSGNPLDIQSGMLGVDSHWMGNNILSSAYGCAYDGGPYVRLWDINEVKKRVAEKLAKESASPEATEQSSEKTGCAVQ